MVLSATRPTQHPDTGIYQFRKAVPERLRDLIGKREVKISLGTRDPQVARRLHAEVAAQVEAEWQERERAAARGDAPPVRLTQEQVVALSGTLYRDLLDRHGSDPGERGRWTELLERAQPALPADLRSPRASWRGRAGSAASRRARPGWWVER